MLVQASSSQRCLSVLLHDPAAVALLLRTQMKPDDLMELILILADAAADVLRAQCAIYDHYPMVVDGTPGPACPALDLEVRALTDKPLALRYRPQTRTRSLMPRVGANVVRRPCRRRRGRYSPLPSSTRSAQAKCGCPETVWPINQYRWLGVQVG
jgi:hypothetical protein